MAKRRKTTKRRRSPAPAPRRRARRSPSPAPRRRRSSSSSSYKFMPRKEQLMDMGGAGVYGMLERAAAAGTAPKLITDTVAKTPLPTLGFSGNVALMARVINIWAKNKYLGHFAQGTASVATYQLMRRGSLFTNTTPATVSGEDDDIGYDDDLDVGALAADVGEDDDIGEDDIEGDLVDDGA